MSVMKNNQIKYILTLLPVLGLAASAWAQDAPAGETPYFYESLLSNSLLIVSGAVILGALGALVYLLNVMVKVQQIKIYQEEGLEAFLEEAKKPQESLWKRLYKRWTNVVPVEKEKDILFDHEYDGIRELDNSLPPWWVALFYITIAFGVVYLFYYHVSGSGLSSQEEYELEMEKAEEAVAAFVARQGDQVDETNVVVLEDENEISLGKAIYEVNCVACHGALGEGGIGPNFSDEYWIHGGDIKDLFRTIKYGVPEKGMISWQTQLRPAEMQRVASYILTFQGTNPPNGKAPEGELYQRDGAQAPVDSTKTDALGLN